nr:hypothetical protein GCM10017611_48600 [Rhodococcus wratislaviensis]
MPGVVVRLFQEEGSSPDSAVDERLHRGLPCRDPYAGWDPDHFAAPAVSALVDSISDYHRNVLTPTAEITIADPLHTPDRP